MFKLRPVAVGISAFLYGIITFNIALADDTEIYVPRDLPADQQVRPNILFILDSSGSMGGQVANTGGKTRNQVMQQVVNNLIDQLKTKEDVNIGLMRYKGLRTNCPNDNRNCENEQGGHIVSPVQRLTSSNADTMKGVVNNIGLDDWTPLSETYYEAYRYMTGQAPVWAAARSVSSSMSGGKYISPITHACQKSHIIYVTDGEPTRDVGSNAAIKSLAGVNTTYKSNTCSNSDGQCLPHLAEYMANQDLFPAPAPFADPTNRKQTVTSHFVGFTVDLPLLRNAATAGAGSYYTSDNVSGLTAALKAIIIDITAENTSFAAPSVAVSAFNNLGFRNDLYYALFRPAEGANWPGNVKRYKLGKDTAGNPLIVDQNNNAAIDDSTGFFSNSASSFWSATADGSDVARGGVAGRLLNPDTRNIFTWTGADRTATATNGVTGSVSLNAASYRLNTSNTALTNTMLGASDTTQKNQFINWARGKNTDGTNRLAIADVLHNEPKLVAYVTDEDLNRVQTAPLTSPEQLYMFFGSNEGFIHAIDPKTGNEKFSFIPKELLPNPGAYLTNAKGSTNKKYGIDGQINLWTSYRTPTAGDVTASRRVLDKAILYAGMRRGGSNYYALDVSNIDAPAFKWMIKGAYNAAPTPGFEKLGMTFSAPKLADVKINNVQTKVLIFSGGYDRDHDNIGTNAPKADSLGNALYVVDAETGKLLWRAGGSGDTGANLQIASMTNSMPADPTIVDINGDGLADIIYASDLRGQVFRFDINNANTGINPTSTFATGGRIAQLGGATIADNRRFFSSPDVALIRERGGKTYFTISIGSGFRESPLNTDTDDRFYVLRDSNVFIKPSTYTTITESDLTNVTGFDLSAGDTDAILEKIRTLEAQMLSINNAVDGARQNFVDYRAGINHTAKQNAASQAMSDADERQKQIDEILGDDPFLVENNENLQQQSKLQSSLEKAQIALAKLQQLFLDTVDLADAADAAALDAERIAADTAYNNAATAYNGAQSTSDSANTARDAAEVEKDAAAASLQAIVDLINARTDAINAWTAAGSPDPDPLKDARDNAIQAVLDAENDDGDEASRISVLNDKTSAYNNTVIAADTAALDAATKLAEKDAAQVTLDSAILAHADAVLNDTNAAALLPLRDNLASEYARLTELQRDLDQAFVAIKTKEAEIIAAQADPAQIDDGLPTLQAELEVLRADYAARAYIETRENLNAGNPSKLHTLLATVQSALDLPGATADIITAVDAALAAMGLDGDITDLPNGFPYNYADLLVREEAAKAATLRAAATNSQTIADQIATLLSEQAALIASGAALQGEADALAALPYNVASAMLSAAQLTALQAQTAPDAPTYFDAYQFLIDQALANAANPATGLPYLRSEIDKEYAKLTPGNSYTPNTNLLAASKGFYLKLPKGEKVLSTSVSFRGAVLFSTFSPRGQAVSTCGSDVGRGRTYALSLIDASALFTETAADGTKNPVRSFDLKRSGIPPTPSVILSEGKPTILTGTEILRNDCVDGAEVCRAGDAVKASYWREN
ncbi:PilC/PilY family type IV pilus protein [Pseudomonas sp.]|uniref:PilC/PilY family type IV pilus protein n=1 Tax=Pseudomonas sp. TaxID=306 RepID=UPI002734ED38|nr:PilC/PilY family type IV pilus protein [Pseudomonas sp.]MDP2746003.1 PilC/PilY family type IV pilus protein [Pseudomonas sp.]